MAFLLPLQAPIALRADAPAALIEGSAALRCEAIGGPVGWSGGECRPQAEARALGAIASSAIAHTHSLFALRSR